MGYKETEAKIKRALNKLESDRSEFFIDKKALEEHHKNSLETMGKILEKLNIGNWHFTARTLDSSTYFAEVRYIDDKSMVRDPACEDALGSIGFWLDRVREDSSYSLIKASIVKGMLNCIEFSSILQLDSFYNTVLKSAEMVEHSITQDMCSEIFDILDEFDNARIDLYDEWYTTETGEAVDKIENLIEQASLEWFKEGNLKAGMSLVCYNGPYKIASVTSDSVTLESGRTYQFGGAYELGGSARAPLACTWSYYHPDLRVNDIIYPFDDENV